MIASNTASVTAPLLSGGMPQHRATWQLRASKASIRKLLAFALTVDLLYALVAELEQFKSKSPASTALETSVTTRDDSDPVQGEDGQQLRRLSVKVTERGLLLDGRSVSASELIAQAQAEKAVKVSLHVGSDVHSIRPEDLKVMVPLNAAGLSVNVVFNQM